MAIPVQMPIELRDAQGSISTRMVQVSDTTIEVEGETTRVPGQHLEFEFAMVGYDRRLTGTAVVEKVTNPEFGRGRCIMRIAEVEPQARSTFRSWLYDLTQGGGRLPTTAPHSSEPSSVRPAPWRRAPSSEGRHSATTMVSASLSPRSGVGRAALRGAMASYGSVPAEPSQDNPPPRGRKRLRLEVRVAGSAEPPVVMVRYNDPALYSKHFAARLRRGVLELRHADSGLHSGLVLLVRLTLPNHSSISCRGKVTAASATAFAIDLDLTRADRETMQTGAGAHHAGGRSRG